MKAIELDGIRINMVDAGDTTSKLEKQIGGKLETITIRDGGVMICDREAMPKDLPYNNIASLIAGTSVYGKALIVGGSHEKFEDVPEQYAILLSFSEKDDNAVPITKLCEHDLKAFETEEPMDAKTANAWCQSCKMPYCDVCNNALRTGKRMEK